MPPAPDPTASFPPAKVLPVLLGFVCFVLGVLLVAPPLLTAQNEALREEIDGLIEPASDTLADFRLRVSLESASVRGYVASGDSAFLAPFFTARARAERRLEHLEAVMPHLGPEAAAALERLAEAHAVWVEPNLRLVAGSVEPDEFGRSVLPQQQERFNAVFAAAATLNGLLREAGAERRAQIREAEEVRDLVTLALVAFALAGAAATLWLGARLRAYAAILEAREGALRDLNETLEQRVEARAAEVRHLTFEVAQAEFRERRRIALVLHDHLQQLLVAAKLRLHVHSDGHAGPNVERLDHLLGEAIETTRSLAVELAPPALQRGGLAEALRWLGGHVEEAYHLVVDVTVGEGVEEEPGDVAVLLFQVARELLFNVVKHAKTDWAGLTLTTSDGALNLAVEDHGVGFDPTAPPQGGTGFGLGSVQERLRLVGGSLHVESRPGEGTRVLVRLPIAAHEAATA